MDALTYNIMALVGVVGNGGDGGDGVVLSSMKRCGFIQRNIRTCNSGE